MSTAADTNAAPTSAIAAAVYSSILTEVTSEPRSAHIVLYDGTCLVCNTFIHFVSDRDPKQLIHFAPLQSEFGKWLLQDRQVPPMDSMVLVEGGHPGGAASAPWFARSTAAVRILAQLEPVWLYSLLWALLLVPAFFRDACYKLFAAWRYRLFGSIEEGEGVGCRVLTRATRGRFLEYEIKARMKVALAAAATNPTESNASSTTIASPTPLSPPLPIAIIEQAASQEAARDESTDQSPAESTLEQRKPTTQPQP